MLPDQTTKQPPQSMSSSNDHDGDKHNKPFDRQVRDMVNAITSRVGGIHKPAGSSHHQTTDEDEHGISIITLAGTNTGATMRTELDDDKGGSTPPHLGIASSGRQTHHQPSDQDEAFGTHVNSNFQSVNNSLMLGSTYNANDPGVHLDISDYFEHHHPHKPDKHAKKGKKKDKEPLKSDHQSD